MTAIGRYYIGHLGKVPVYVQLDAIFLIIFVFFMRPELDFPQKLVLLMVLVLTILVHEVGHALIAGGMGMNNIAITVTALGGYCSYVGVPRPWRGAGISLAGPLVNLAVGGGLWAAMPFIDRSVHDHLLLFALESLMFWNLLLGVFNLLPIYPLDGGQVVLNVAAICTRTPKRARSIALWISMIAGGLLLAYILLPLFHGGRLDQYTEFNALLIGFMLFNAYRDLKRV